MRALVQRVSEAGVSVGGEEIAAIDGGLLVLVGVEQGDGDEQVTFLARKIANLRVFEDDDGKMNLSVVDTGGSVLAVSQFTLWGDCRKGRRPSFTSAAAPELAERLYEHFVERVAEQGIRVATGQFAARMDVALVNDGPVTLVLESW